MELMRQQERQFGKSTIEMYCACIGLSYFMKLLVPASYMKKVGKVLEKKKADQEYLTTVLSYDELIDIY
jgi:hypothetical protein